MKNSIEEKTKLFSLYLGCDLIVPELPKGPYYPFDQNEQCLTLIGIIRNRIVVRRIAEEVEDKFVQCRLHLRSFNDLTDEEYQKVAEIIFPEERGAKWVRTKVNAQLFIADAFVYNKCTHHADTLLEVEHYLRSIGIALPYNGRSVEEMIELNWVVLKICK